MKYVVNRCFGGFSVNEEWAKAHGYGYNLEIPRTDENLIHDIENGVNVNDSYSKLKVIEIPDEATDWELENYDGCESIIAVIDGKIIHI